MLLDAGLSIAAGDLVFAVLCAVFAANRGRNWVAWFVIGLVLSCLGLLLVFLLPDLSGEPATGEPVAKPDRVLREQLRIQRQVADRRDADVHRRLDTHDAELHIDTRSEDAARLGAEAGGSWHWIDDGESRGPVAEDELGRLWRDGRIDDATYVWSPEFADWHRLRDLPELRQRLVAEE